MALALLSLLVGLHAAEAKTAPPWCAPELKTLDHAICAHQTPAPDGEPRVLVIFLHGLVKTDSSWQHHHQRALVRGAARKGYGVLMPRGIPGGHPHYPDKTGWPVTAADQRKHEGPMFAQWRAARATLEEGGGPFDRVVVMGLSSGAYYASSIAQRGAFAPDGFAVFAGGAPFTPATDHRPPFFVGICDHNRTAAGARLLADALRDAGWPSRALAVDVGHDLADAHLDAAIDYLRRPPRE